MSRQLGHGYNKQSRKEQDSRVTQFIILVTRRVHGQFKMPFFFLKNKKNGNKQNTKRIMTAENLKVLVYSKFCVSLIYPQQRHQHDFSRY